MEKGDVCYTKNYNKYSQVKKSLAMKSVWICEIKCFSVVLIVEQMISLQLVTTLHKHWPYAWKSITCLKSYNWCHWFVVDKLKNPPCNLLTYAFALGLHMLMIENQNSVLFVQLIMEQFLHLNPWF